MYGSCKSSSIFLEWNLSINDKLWQTWQCCWKYAFNCNLYYYFTNLYYNKYTCSHSVTLHRANQEQPARRAGHADAAAAGGGVVSSRPQFPGHKSRWGHKCDLWTWLQIKRSRRPVCTIKRSRGAEGDDQAIKDDFCRSRFLIPVANASTGDI